MTDTNKMRDESREQFEAWHRSVVEGEPPHEKYSDGSYVNPHVNRYWTGWQASRQAVVVELPELVGITNAEEVDGSVIIPKVDQAYDQAIQECREAVEAQGLRVGVRK